MTLADTSNIIQLAPFVDYLYEVLPNNYNKDQASVYLKDGTWEVVIKTDCKDSMFHRGTVTATARFDKIEDVVGCLADRYFNLQLFEIHLHQATTNKALVAKLDYERIVEVVGEEAVCQAEEGWNNFANTIVKYVDKIERKKNIKLVEEMK